jgi:uncharacterized protein (DUF983 family)
MMRSTNDAFVWLMPADMSCGEELRFAWTAKRLAVFRRRLVALMTVTGAPIVALHRAESPTIRHVLMILALVCLGLVFPLIRVLCVEWHNNRALEAARTDRWCP